MNEQEPHDPLRAHSFDGIQEYDNQLPRWWLTTFWMTVIFGLAYWIYYSVLGIGPNQAAEFAQAMRDVKAAAVVAQPANGGGASGEADTFDAAGFAKIKTDSATLANAAKIYAKNCASCHGEHGEGVIGPNLTDTFWLHGGTPEKIFATITNGVPDKGMLTWKGMLTPAQILELSAYILSLQGSNPPNAKAPQGNPE